MEEKKIVVKLQKEMLESEREELRQKKTARLILVSGSLVLFILGVLLGVLVAPSVKKNKTEKGISKVNEVSEYMESSWLYASDYEDLHGELENRALYGMTSFVDDPYTTYMSTEEMESFSDSINMDYVGVGMRFYDNHGMLIVTDVFKDSPAEKAGFLSGDILKCVDGKSLEGYTTEEVKELVLGEEGTTVSFTILRNNEELNIDAIRGAVNSTVFAYAQDDYVVLELMSFGMDTAAEIEKYLDDYTDYHKIIIDLRADGGGYQSSVQEVCGLFLGKNKLVMTQTYNDGSYSKFMTTAKKHYKNFDKYVLLVDGDTASAAEVFTLALKENLEDVTIVGTTTFGKGVVQSNYVLSDGSALKVTSSKWLSPNGKWINGEGIEPDVEVLLDPVLYEGFPYFMDEKDTYVLDDVSDYVRLAEMAVNYLDYPSDRQDGYFDVSFETALKQFQKDNHLADDGILNSETYEALVSCISYEWYQNPEKDVQMVKAQELMNDR